MKRYKKRIKPVKVSKRSLESRLQSTESAKSEVENALKLSRHYTDEARRSLRMEVVRSNGYRDEVVKLQEKLEKVTEPVWRHARMHLNPPIEVDPESIMQIWRCSGQANIAIAVDLHEVRSLPRGEREAYLSMLVDDFTKKAREQAIRNFKILLE
jgi:hypothetical protein